MADTIQFTVRGDTYKECRDAAEAEADRVLGGMVDMLGYEYVPAHQIKLDMDCETWSRGDGRIELRTYSAAVTVILAEQERAERPARSLAEQF